MDKLNHMITAGEVAILIVDDESAVREILEDVLAEEGFAVYSAAHGAEALEILAKCKLPSLILLDVMMPVMDGIQFLKELRAREELKDRKSTRLNSSHPSIS